jgi:hypothetical protein
LFSLKRTIRITTSVGTTDVSKLAILAERVGTIICDRHQEYARLHTVVGTHAGISGCCKELLDRVELEMGITKGEA